MPTYILYGDHYTSFIVDDDIADSMEVHQEYRYGFFMDIIQVSSPEEAMHAWSVHENNSLTFVKPGVWRAKYDLTTAATRDYEVEQRIKVKAKRTHVVAHQEGLL